MINAIWDEPTESRAFWAVPVTAASFPANSFNSVPSNTLSTDVQQGGASNVVITWGEDTTGDTGIEFTGGVPGLCSPDTEDY